MLKLATLASGSAGNCAVVSDGETYILIDAGIRAKQIFAGLRSLGVAPDQLSAILITHAHSDHITGLQVLSKKVYAPVYATQPTCRAIYHKSQYNGGLLQEQAAGTGLQIGSLWAECFPTPHDAPGSVGWSVSGGGRRLVLCTDLGHVTSQVHRAVEGCNMLVCEANHDIELLKSGPYPYHLKKRIAGDYGHLSNEAGGALALFAVRQGAKQIVLAHLSEQNNTPQLAYTAVSQIMEEGGFRTDRDVTLSVAARSGCSGWLEV